MNSHARVLFSIAAFFNFVVGAVFLFAMSQFGEIIGMRPVPSDPLLIHFGSVLVITFGWGYLQIAADPVTNRPIIKLGIIGKLAVVLAGFSDWFLGNTNAAFPLILIADFVFVFLFLNYLKLRRV